LEKKFGGKDKRIKKKEKETTEELKLFSIIIPSILGLQASFWACFDRKEVLYNFSYDCRID
jgi:hypothetical protein